jgi:hypothetical protein
MQKLRRSQAHLMRESHISLDFLHLQDAGDYRFVCWLERNTRGRAFDRPQWTSSNRCLSVMANAGLCKRFHVASGAYRTAT